MKHETVDCRRDPRRPTYIVGKLSKAGGSHKCWVRDISAGGALVFVEAPLDQGERLVVEVESKRFAAYVRWIDYPLAGLQFEPNSMVTANRNKDEPRGRSAITMRQNLSKAEERWGSRIMRWARGD